MIKLLVLSLPHKQCQIAGILRATVTYGLVLSLWGCNNQAGLRKQLIGSWANLDLKVSINHAKQDSASQFEVPEGQWENILNIKPIITEFRDDGSYRSEYRSLKDSLIREVEGKWDLSQDTLILIEDGTATLYHAEIKDSKVTFTGWLDWDQDGEADDLYIGRQVKVADNN